MFATAFQANAFQVNAFQIYGGPTPTNAMDMHDGISKEELKRIREIQKKLRKAENERNQLKIEKTRARKETIANLVNPKKVAKVVENKVKLIEPKIEKVEIDIQSLIDQKDRIIREIALRQEQARLQMEFAVYEAKRKAELDDEESILAILL
jgi:exonuclease VII large subunit